jgi:hypothetical protein
MASGDLFLPTDGYSLQRSDGANWYPWGPIFPLTDPTTKSFSWTNQGSASVDSSKGSIFLRAPAASGTHLRIQSYTLTAPWTIVAGFIPQLMPISGDPICGVCYRDSSGGKLSTVAIYTDGSDMYLSLQKYSDANTWNSNYLSVAKFQAFLCGGPIMWVKLNDDGTTNRTTSVSKDGQNWTQVHQVGRTDYFTADSAGFFATSSQTTYDVGMNLLSWKESH